MRADDAEGLKIIFGIICFIIGLAGWVTHVVVCIKAGAYLLLIAGAIMFPIAIIHGVGHWFGAWN